MTESESKRSTIYDYLVKIFPDRIAPPNFVMTKFEKQLKEAIPNISMSYGFIACQTNLYLHEDWVYEPKVKSASYGNQSAYVPRLNHSAEPMLTNIVGVPEETVDDTFSLQNFNPVDSFEIRHFRTGKIIDNMFSTFDEQGGMMSTVNFQVMGKGGTGKTFLMMCMARDFKDMQPDMNILHVNSEMTEVLMQAYIKKAPNLEGIDLLIMRKYHPDRLAEVFIKAMDAKKWNIIVLDSFQDLVVKLQDSLGMNSSKAEAWLVNIMSEMNNRCGTSFFVLNHVNKDGSAAGKSYLKHILDGMMEIHRDEHDKNQRYVKFSKNRVGIDEVQMYYEILKANDPRGPMGTIVWDEERYNRIHEQKEFVERNKLHITKDLNKFSESEFVDDSEDSDGYN